MHVKKGDKVVVISGKDKGKSGKILTSIPKDNRVIIEGINMQTKHKKADRNVQQAGIIHQEGAISVTNVMVYCNKCKTGVRTRIKVLGDGKKGRECIKCGEIFE